MASGMNPEKMKSTSELERQITTPDEFARLVDAEYASAKGTPFRPQPVYDHKDDCLVFFMRDVTSVRRRINGLLTLYLAADDRTLVGCEVKSVRRMLEIEGSFGVLVADHKLKLGVLLAFALIPTLTETEPEAAEELNRYTEELEQYKDVEIEEDMLACAAC